MMTKKEEIIEILNKYARNYRFLGLNSELWQKAFNRASQDYPNLSPEEALDRWITRYIAREIELKKVRILDNILKLESRNTTNMRLLLKNFWRRIKEYKIPLTDEYFEIFKTNSKLFSSYLKTLTISSFNKKEFQAFVLGKYDAYMSFKTPHMTLEETIKFVDYYLSLTKTSLNNLTQDKTSPKYKKLKFLISNYYNIEKLFEIACQNQDISKKYFYQFLINMPLNSLENLLEDYRTFLTLPDKTNFLNTLYYRLGINMPVKPKQPKNEIVKEIKQVEISESDSNTKPKEDEPKEQTPQKNIKSRKRYTTIYEYVPDILGVTEEEKKMGMDDLFAKLPAYEQETVARYLNNEFKTESKEVKKAQNIIYKLKNQYCNHFTLKPKKRGAKRNTTIYEYAPDILGVAEEEKKMVMDDLFAKLPAYEQEIVTKYINKEFKSTSKEGNKALNIISKLKRQYKRHFTLKQKRGVKRNTTIYEYAPDMPSVTEEEKKMVMDDLLAKLPAYEQEIVTRYLNKEFKRDNKVNAILNRLRAQYDSLCINCIETIASISELINAEFQTNIPSEISFAKKRLLCDALKVVEYCYRTRKLTRTQYTNMCKERLIEIFTMNPSLSLEDLIISYINIAYQDIKEKEDNLQQS